MLSEGRLDLGIGKGYRYTEFKGFGIPIGEADTRFEEALTILVKSWTTADRFSYRGRFWTFDDIVVEPKPYQKPYPPLWMGAASEASIRRVAERRCNLLLDQYASVEAHAERTALFRAEVERCGREFDPMSVIVARNLYVARNDADRESALEATVGRNSVFLRCRAILTARAARISSAMTAPTLKTVCFTARRRRSPASSMR